MFFSTEDAHRSSARLETENFPCRKQHQAIQKHRNTMVVKLWNSCCKSVNNMVYHVRIIRNLFRTINMVFKWVPVAEENWTGSWFPSCPSRIHPIESHLSELFRCPPWKKVNREAKDRNMELFAISWWFSLFSQLFSKPLTVISGKIHVCRNEWRQWMFLIPSAVTQKYPTFWTANI